MRVAIPLFGDEVSPRFGCSTQFLLATLDGNRVQNEELEDVGHLAPWQFADYLASRQVAAVICGGVHRHFQDELERRGMEVIWGVIGPAADALVAMASGTLRRDQFLCPGRHGRGGRGGRGRGRGPGGGPPQFPGSGQNRPGRGLGGRGGPGAGRSPTMNDPEFPRDTKQTKGKNRR